MNQFPQALYRAGGAEKLDAGMFTTVLVLDAEQQAARLADGWHETQEAALAAKQADEDKPTRAELEQKASELKLKFDGRTTDKKLGDLIAAKLG